MKSNWNYPTTMWVGENRIKDLGIACKTLNINKPLLVTDTGLAKSNIIIDVRTPEEFGEGFIKNATNLNIYDSSNFIEKIKSFSSNKEYYIYCKSGARSSAACKIMNQMGFNNVYNLLGGISEWNGEIIN